MKTLRELDYSVLQQCMHCGMCLPACPTYGDTKLERNSPRGRISLMRAIADDKLEVTKAFGEEMQFCLGCLACQTACPAGVNYAELFESSRYAAEKARVLDTPVRTTLRALTLRWLFQNQTRLRLLGRLLWLHQRSGLQTLVRKLGVMRLFPEWLRNAESKTPEIATRFSPDIIKERETPAEVKYRVGLLTGCVQDLVFAGINRDTVDVLLENGCEVVTPRLQGCCGSLHAHNGDPEGSKAAARQLLYAFPLSKLDAVITNAGGCGSHLKQYAHLLADDPQYAERAAEWSRKVKDISEFLVEIGFRAPASGGGEKRKVTYHESCHLCHGQRITAQPRKVLKAIPGLDLVEMKESTWCCGSAGIYNLTQPEMAGKLLTRKTGHIRATGAAVVASGNPGCSLHIRNGCTAAAMDTEVSHPVTLLAEAYRSERR